MKRSGVVLATNVPREAVKSLFSFAVLPLSHR
jgi:hypothetical protein